MSERILVGYDGSAEADDALELGAVLAETLEAVLVVTTVAPRPRRGRFGARAEERREREAGADVAAGVARAQRRSPGLPVESRTPGGATAAAALDEMAAHEDAALVVVGSTRRSAIGRVLAGSTAGRLVGHAACPVAVAPAGYARSAPAPLRIVGLAFDASGEARGAAEVAVEIARRAAAGLRVFGVVEHPPASPVPLAPSSAAAHEPRFDRDELRREIDRLLDELPDEIGGQEVVLSGEPVDALVGTGRRAMDLLVLGSHGHGPLTGALVRSTAHGVASRAPWPVVVVPPGTRRLGAAANAARRTLED